MVVHNWFTKITSSEVEIIISISLAEYLAYFDDVKNIYVRYTNNYQHELYLWYRVDYYRFYRSVVVEADLRLEEIETSKLKVSGKVHADQSKSKMWMILFYSFIVAEAIIIVFFKEYSAALFSSTLVILFFIERVVRIQYGNKYLLTLIEKRA